MTGLCSWPSLLTSAPTLTGLGAGQASLPRLLRSNKFREPRFGGAGKVHGLAAPGEPDGAGVQSVIRQNEPGALLRRQAIFDQRQIQILIAAVELVADEGMAEVGEVDADLMFAAGAGNGGARSEEDGDGK